MLKLIFFKSRSAASPSAQVGKVIVIIYSIFPLRSRYLALGLRYLKQHQDEKLPPEQHYVRYAEEVPPNSVITHEEDEPNDMVEETLRIVICMTTESSQRLLNAQYLQSDIAFKRVAGFLEFEIASLDRNAQIGLSML